VSRSRNADHGTALVVPDPRRDLFPAGWWDQTARPVIEAADWERLEHLEGQIRAAADYIDALGGAPNFELRAAWRCIEKRRGDLLGPAERGRPKANTRVTYPDDVSPMTVSRWRTIADHWDDVIYPALLDAGMNGADPWEATQTRCLTLVEHERMRDAAHARRSARRRRQTEPVVVDGHHHPSTATQVQDDLLTAADLLAVDVRDVVRLVKQIELDAALLSAADRVLLNEAHAVLGKIIASAPEAGQ
jgi:hypothetical protein